MLRLLGLAISIGVADSLNPSTIGPALYLATGERPRRQVVHFTAGVFGVYFVGGALLLLGPGQLLLSILPHPSHQIRYVIEIGVGAALLTGALILWENRHRLVDRDPPGVPVRGRSSALLGASITALELPTAFPYFALIAALVGSGIGPLPGIALLAVFNVFFIAPLLGILFCLSFFGDRARLVLGRAREFLNDHWPQVLATLLLLAGVFVLLLGITGLGGRGHGRFGRIMRRIRHIVP